MCNIIIKQNECVNKCVSVLNMRYEVLYKEYYRELIITNSFKNQQQHLVLFYP